jgi:CBS domain-containing protein
MDRVQIEMGIRERDQEYLLDGLTRASARPTPCESAQAAAKVAVGRPALHGGRTRSIGKTMDLPPPAGFAADAGYWHRVCNTLSPPTAYQEHSMKHLGELTVGDYMTESAIVVDDTQKLTAAIRLMDVEQISILPVVDEAGDLAGILSVSDLISIIHEIQSDIGALSHVTDKTRDFLITMLTEQGDNTLVADVMTTPVQTVTPRTNLVVAARKLVDCQYHHLPVINDAGKTIGMLSTSDFVRAVADYGAIAAG